MNDSVTQVALLTPLRRHDDAALLLLRVTVGAFLIWGVADNILSADRMAEFEAFLTRFGFAAPALMARLSVWVQLAIGAGFIVGLATRWAGIVCAIHFIVAIVMVDAHAGIRASFPSACLVVIGLYLATHGAGRFGVDRLIESRAARP